MYNDGIKRFDNKKIWKSFLFSVFCFLGLLLFSIQVKAEILESNVDLYYSFDAETEADALKPVSYSYYNSSYFDLQKGGYNTNSISFQESGKFGSCFNFSENCQGYICGSNYLRTSDLSSLNINNVGIANDNQFFTYSIWFQANSLVDGQVPFHFTSYYNGARQGMNSVDTDSATYYTYNGSAGDVWNATSTLGTSWHNYIMTGQWKGEVKFYVDGVLADTVEFSTVDYTSGQKLWIIALGSLMTAGSYGQGIIGKIDDFFILNKDLTQNDIDLLQNCSLDDVIHDNCIIQPQISILAFGYPNIWSNPSIFPYNGTKTYPIYYNLCNAYNDLNKAYIVPKYSDLSVQPVYMVIKDKSTFVGPQKCSGSYFIKDNRSTADSGTVYFDLVAVDINNNVIASTSSNIITFEEESTPNTFIDALYDKTLNIDLGNLGVNPDYTASTTRLYFNYDFHEKNYASTTVYLWDQILATSTGYTSYGPFSSTSSAVGFIDIPTPEIQTFKNYYFIADIPGYKKIKSDLFSVNWDFWPEEVYFECEEIEVDLSNICDGIPETTIGDWICEGKTALYKATNWALYPKCKDLIKLQIAFNKFKDSFPFNIYFDLNESIKSSINNATSTENGISVPFIRKTATSSEFYMLPIAGTSSFSNLIGNDNYNTYRTTLAFIYWLLVALLIYLQIRK